MASCAPGRLGLELGHHQVEVVEALDLRIEHVAGRPADRCRLGAQALQESVAGRPTDVGLHQDDQVGHAARRIHQRLAVGAARHDPLDVGLAQAVAPHRLDDEIFELAAIDRRDDADRGQRAPEAVDVRAELEDAAVPGDHGLEHAVTIEHGVVEHGDPGLRLRHELAVHVDDGLSHVPFNGTCVPPNYGGIRKPPLSTRRGHREFENVLMVFRTAGLRPAS